MTLVYACLTSGSLFEEYCAIASYEAEEDSEQLSMSSGDQVLVVSKDESGEVI